MNLLDVKNLQVHFPVKHGVFSRVKARVRAVDDVSLTVAAGETLGVVGESGCGKTTLGRAILRLIEPTAGHIFFAGEEISSLRGSELRARRRKFQMIFQDPYGSLNPRMTVEQIIGEAIDIHKLAADAAARWEKIAGLLESVGLDAAQAGRYPHEFSGGQRQRIGIARALALHPEVLVADEPVSALDVSVQAQVLALLADIKARLHLSMLFVTHDLRVALQVCDRIAVMKQGEVVEVAPTAEIFFNPQHSYTKALFAAVPGGTWQDRKAS